jgi:hypothetical protein
MGRPYGQDRPEVGHALRLTGRLTVTYMLWAAAAVLAAC